jgi:hypothetical protein
MGRGDVAGRIGVYRRLLFFLPILAVEQRRIQPPMNADASL